MKIRNLFASLIVCLLMGAGMAKAQGVGASGDIKGTVSDPTGAVIANATVTASDSEKGIKRTAQSDSSGQYVISGVPPANYEVSARIAGFDVEIHKSVVVNIGQTTIVDFHPKVSSTNEQVEVTTEAPVVETERGSEANVVDNQYIQNLPIDQRDYLSYTLLLPGVSDARGSVGTDFHVRQTPQTGLSFYGSNGRGNNVTVDGGQFNGDSGAVEVNLSQDAVQEFQINRSSYSAELGAASGASINIVSKSGTNDLHGSIYGFFRNDAMDARNPFAFTNALAPGQPFSLNATSVPTNNTLSRQQYGATLGFPIQKDKTFFFASYEGLRDHEQTAVPLLTNSNIFAPDSAARGNDQQEILGGLAALGGTPVPCLTGQPALPAATCAAVLQNILTINPATSPLSKFLVNEFESNGGLFPFSTINNYWSARLDHTFNDSNQAYLRGIYGLSDVGNPSVGALEGVSRGSAVKQWTASLLGAWYHQFSPKTQNEFRAQYNLVQFNVFANDPGGPELDVGAFQFGRDNTLPDFSTLRQYEFADNLTLIRGHHTMKLGFYEDVRGNRTASATFIAPRISFGSLPGGILSPCLQVPAACGLGGVSPATLNPLQSFSLGLPTFYQQGFGNPTTVADLPLTSVYWQDSWAIRPNFTLNYGLRYDRDTRDVMPTDKLNFAPRVSFAWDLFKDHKTVLRGGGGIFYSPTYVQIDFATRELGILPSGSGPQISNFLIPLTGAPGNPALTSAAIFQTLFAQGKLGTGLFPNNPCNLSGGPSGAGSGACITQADLAIFGALNAFPAFFSVPKNFHNSYSEQGSIGIENQISKGTSFSADYIYVHTLRLPWTQNINLLPTAPTVTGVPGTNGLPFQTWNSQLAPQCALLVNNPCLVSPLLIANDQYSSTGSALYHGLTVEVKKRFNEHYSFLANYTWSKAIDDITDFNISYSAQNNANLGLDRGLSTFDQRHKFTFAGIFDSPWKNPIIGGFEFSPILRYNSGHPFNLLAGADLNGDNNSNTDRPPGAGRNTGLGPNYFDIDARLSRRIKITERVSLQLMAEAFNLFNRTNYSGVNNVVGPAFGPPFNVSGTNAVGPGVPLGFTSASAKREIQLGVRLAF
ncbi:MAG TPA: TonB-dependent receptor [Candidatus Angelobacter sp.]